MCKTINTPQAGAQSVPLEPASAEQLKNYFSNLLNLKKTNYQYPVNLDDVWPICYSRKDAAVRELRDNYYEGIDYVIVKTQANTQSADNQLFHRFEENSLTNPQFCGEVENQQITDEDAGCGVGRRSSNTYYLSISCMEYLVARRRREVFEVYRKVFDAYTSVAEQQARQQAAEIRNAPVETRPDGRRIFLDYRLFAHKFYLLQSTADYEIHSYCKELIGRLQEGYNFPVDANEVYLIMGFSSAAQLTTWLKGGNPKKANPDAPYKVDTDYICNQCQAPGWNLPKTFRALSIAAFGRLLREFNAPRRFLAIYRQYFPNDNMRQDEVLKLYPVGLTLSQATADPAVCIDEALHLAQLEQDENNRHAFATGQNPKRVPQYKTLPQQRQVTMAVANEPQRTAEVTAGDCCPSFTRLFQSIMSMRGRMSDSQIVESLYDLQRLASL